MRKIFYLFISIYSIGISGQIGSNPSPSPADYGIDMYPKTPEAAALSKFVDLPAGNYTGIADFSIPFYTIEFEGEKIPIELRYTTTSIKVSDVASNEGLGWVLSAGPSLSQQVMGIQDRSFPRPIISSNFNPAPNSNQGVPGNDYYTAMVGSGLIRPYGGDPMDLKPDIFTYNLLDKNGKFIIDASGSYGIPMPYNQIKITPSEAYYRMNIVDEKGFQYRFDDNYQSIKTRNNCADIYANELFDFFDPNFKIYTITSPKNQKINFVYGSNTFNASTYVSSVTTQKRVSIDVPSDQSAPPEAAKDHCVNYTYSLDTPLTEIQFKGGKVLFTYNDPAISPRQDIRNGVYLTGVVVQNDKGEIIKSFTLNYDYFSSPGGIPTIPQFSITNAQSYLYGLDKRLKLLSVKDNLTNGIYNLEYYEDSPLPNRISNDQDFWGVYNGAGNGDKSISLSKYDNINFQSSLIGANKEPNIIYGKQGNLKRIHYPTGGYSEIEYEADDFQLLNPEVINQYGDEEQYPFHNEDDGVSKEIPIPSTALLNKTLYFYTPHTGSTNTGDCNWTLTNNLGTQVGSGKGPGTFNRSDPAGTYYLKVFQDHGYIVNNLTANTCYADYTYTERPIISSETIDTRQAGTIRVSKIQSFDNNNGSIIRQYTYKVPNEDGSFTNAKTSGVNMGEETFMPLSMNEFPISSNAKFGTAIEIMASNNPGWQTTTVRGKSVGYTYVQEHYINGTEPSKSYIKQYTFQNEETGAYQYYDPTTPVNVSWPIDGLDRGLLKAEILFNSGNNKVKETYKDYQKDNHFNLKYASDPNMSLGAAMGYGLEVVPIFMERFNSGSAPNYNFRWATFPLTNYWIKENSTIVKDYVSSTDYVETTQSNNYSPDYKHTYPTESLTEGSGDILKTTFKYPQDVTASELGAAQSQIVLNNLITKNELADPVIVKSYKNNVINSEVKTFFNEYNTNVSGTTMILPKYIYMKKGENAAEEDRKITFNSYDDQGNLTQYTLENGIPVSVIWGYNKTMPIAKIEGAQQSGLSSSDINTLVGISDADNNYSASVTADQTEQDLINALDTFRKSLPNYQITTYTYDPLFGVRSVTPPSGLREYYTYDTAGRLKEVKRAEKDSTGTEVLRVLKKNEYHYQQP